MSGYQLGCEDKRTRGGEMKGVFIPGWVNYQDIRGLTNARAFSFHHLLPGCKETREKRKHGSGPRLYRSLEINVWDISLCCGLHTGREAGFICLGCILQIVTRTERALGPIIGEMTKGTKSVYPGEEKAGLGKGSNCLENLDKL